jgi:hypothetical protein
MFDVQTTALLQAVHKEICRNLSQYETRTRTHVASKILESANSGEQSIAGLKKAGNDALRYAIMTWRLET